VSTTTPYTGKIPSYTGSFPAPLPVMWYVPANAGEVLKVWFPPSEIRGWVREAAAYHDVPHELAAVILQQENGPNATLIQKLGQFAERSLTTFFAIVDEAALDLVPDKISGGSAGIANLSRATLRDAANYIESTYDKKVLPPNVRDRVLGWKQDTRIQGDDLKSDLYYMTAHLRQLIDRVTGKPKFSGELTLEQMEKVCAGYNGSGPLAAEYGRDAMARLKTAADGGTPLYFFQLP
jgi:hypothetical protein